VQMMRRKGGVGREYLLHLREPVDEIRDQRRICNVEIAAACCPMLT
jgi:hypothetical protein